MGQCCLNIDFFSRRLHLRLPSGQEKFRTGAGVCMSLLYMTMLVAVFGLYALLVWRENEENGQLKALENSLHSDILFDFETVETIQAWFKFVVKLLADFGGLAVVFYAIFGALARCCTKNKLEDYLVTELFAPAEPENLHNQNESETVEKPQQLRRKRDCTYKDFYNEIVHSDEEVLDKNGAKGTGPT